MQQAQQIHEDDESVVPPQPAMVDVRQWIEVMTWIARHYRLDVSPESLQLAGQWSGEADHSHTLRRLAKEAGLNIRQLDIGCLDWNQWRLPLVVELKGGQLAVVEQIASDGSVGVRYSGDQGELSRLMLEDLQSGLEALFILRPLRAIPDSRVDAYLKPQEEQWVRRLVLSDWRSYSHLFLATFLINVLGLSGILFLRQVYDRVIPAQSYPTLYVLFIGVLIAICFVFIFRVARARVIDLVGKRADLRISDLVYGRVLRIRNTDRPQSTGALISQVKELDHVREMLTSTTVAGFADIPFFLVFSLVMWYLAGPLVWIPLGAVALMLLPPLLAQRRLREYAHMSMREGSLRNAILVEAIQGYEDIKSLQAEPRFQDQWNTFNAATAEASLRLRSLVSRLTSWSSAVHAMILPTILLAGAPMVINSEVSAGTLMAATILGTRMVSPMTGLTGLLSRWQQAKVAMRGLNSLMDLPLDVAHNQRLIHNSNLAGDYEIRNARVFYRSDARRPALHIKGLTVKAGERIAILGRNGAGKSTLLHLMSGMILPREGEITLDGVALEHLDPADVRRDVSLLSQGASLFHGTIRDNLLLGRPQASDEEILSALEAAGALEFVRHLSEGWGYTISEGGSGMSGGQRQALLLARLFLKEPNVVLLDEPTASLDEAAEKNLIQELDKWTRDRTLIVATHRKSVLQIVDRIIVLDGGYIILDDTKEAVLARLSRRPVNVAVSRATPKG